MTSVCPNSMSNTNPKSNLYKVTLNTNFQVFDPINWARKENLSFCSYPLTYKGIVVGVLALFSEKRFLISDFEILEIFCRQLSKELTTFFDAKEFLSEI